MAKTFDQAICDETAYDLYSARNAKFDELAALILEINELKDQSTNTRTTKGKYNNLKTKSGELVTLLTNKNRALCTAFFKLNSKMTNNAKYISDQSAFRGWIRKLEDALLDLEAKLEDENVISTQSILQAPAASDINSVLLQMSKQFSDSQKQMSKEFK